MLIGGFAVGAVLGTVILQSGSSGPKATAPNNMTSSDRGLATTAASPARSEQLQSQQRIPPEPTAYEQMVNHVAAGQSGRITFGQIVAIARMTGSQPGSPTYEQLVAQVSEMQGGRISLHQMLALRSVGVQPSPTYGGAPTYGPPVRQAARAGLSQAYYDSLAAYEGVRGPSARAADATFQSRMPGAALPSVEQPPSSIGVSPSSRRLMDVSSGQYMSPAAGGYTDPRNGTFYAQSGPNGVVNTTTGEFIPSH